MSLQTQHDEAHALMLDRRDIYPEDACGTCGGYGVRTYSSGATWRGGMGTTSSAKDVCNFCWGSGSKSSPWLNLKTFEADRAAEIQRRSLTLLADVAGTNLAVMRPAIDALVEELKRLTRGRKERPPFFIDLCLGLINTFTKR